MAGQQQAQGPGLGEATQEPSTGNSTISPGEFTQLQSEWRRNAGTGGLPFLGVMLHRRAGWKPDAIAEFLGCTASQAQEWIDTYASGGLNTLMRR
jgi:hypothetical protein